MNSEYVIFQVICFYSFAGTKKKNFLTLSKSDVYRLDKTSFASNVLNVLGSDFTLAEELHKDGTKHLYAVIRTKKSYKGFVEFGCIIRILTQDLAKCHVKMLRHIKNVKWSLNYTLK